MMCIASKQGGPLDICSWFQKRIDWNLDRIPTKMGLYVTIMNSSLSLQYKSSLQMNVTITVVDYDV